MVRFTLLVLALGAAACGGSSEGGHGSTGGSAGSGTGGSGASGGSGATGGSGGGAVCTGFLDETPPEKRTVVIRNNGAQVLYLGSTVSDCGPFVPFEITDPSGNAAPTFAGGCGYTCEDLQTHSGICAADCALPSVITLTGAGMYQTEWSATVFASTEMPASCFFDATSNPGRCPREVVPQAGSYVFTATASAQCTGCDCQVDAEGSCQNPGGQIGAITHTSKLEVTLPSSGPIEIVVNPPTD